MSVTPSSIPSGFGEYDVDGVDGPLVITHEHAKDIGATEHKPVSTSSDDGKARPIKDILADVGEDKNLASEALAAEQARETPRPTLVAQLERLAAPDES